MTGASEEEGRRQEPRPRRFGDLLEADAHKNDDERQYYLDLHKNYCT